MIGELPTSLIVGAEEWDIRTDFRDVLKILLAFGDPNVDDAEKVLICLQIIYESFEEMPPEDYEEAFKQALNFIDCDMPEGKADKHSPRTMDWEQDGNIIIPAINKVAGYEVRSVKYLHWWSFMGYFMEISTDGVFGTVLRLRQKKRPGSKASLDKFEKEFWNANRELCELKPKLSDDEIERKKRLNEMLKR